MPSANDDRHAQPDANDQRDANTEPYRPGKRHSNWHIPPHRDLGAIGYLYALDASPLPGTACRWWL